MTTQDAQIVKLGDRSIFYSRSEPLARNIDRYVQLKYPFYMFDEKSFEIDEDGQPWWICPVQTRTIGLFGGTTIERVVMVNATTGECTDLAIDDVPNGSTAPIRPSCLSSSTTGRASTRTAG